MYMQAQKMFHLQRVKNGIEGSLKLLFIKIIK